ncbi:hypothetical protein BST61_g9944 [Cercospora zeina]
MAPIARSLIKLTQRIKDVSKRNSTLNLVERATYEPDLAHFTNAVLKNPTHTSNSDSTPHVTALLATDDQAVLVLCLSYSHKFVTR